MIILFIIGLGLGGLAVVFALQNVAIITVSFFGWSLTGSLSVILSLAVFSGVVIAVLLLLPGSMGSYFKYRKLKKENVGLLEELRKQKEKTIFAKNTPPTQNDIAKIEDGASDEHAL